MFISSIDSYTSIMSPPLSPTNLLKGSKRRRAASPASPVVVAEYCR